MTDAIMEIVVEMMEAYDVTMKKPSDRLGCSANKSQWETYAWTVAYAVWVFFGSPEIIHEQCMMYMRHAIVISFRHGLCFGLPTCRDFDFRIEKTVYIAIRKAFRDGYVQSLPTINENDEIENLLKEAADAFLC
jgi:hypothetical protein